MLSDINLIMDDQAMREHCADPENVYCCKRFEGVTIDGFGIDCKLAKTYENNRGEDRVRKSVHKKTRVITTPNDPLKIPNDSLTGESQPIRVLPNWEQ